ncbi:uncharacterized protein BJ212DRAFT_1483762 [Suillus subaureus]|uniref:Uncharacterized protein n=1 Tax=Suillus subaureus TaxID=48587 RepID=A0A9P7E5J9_9AGAM|nr:uncharacterized protein BJ212DRAFT_1483762 [Suillus subaureus]KAG1811510.1 hypothetical protein BJ212DRAFT_1483762 [Suillus subaureus]
MSVMECIIIVTVPGLLVEPINPDPTIIHLQGNINTDDFSQVNGSQSTWQITPNSKSGSLVLWI